MPTFHNHSSKNSILNSLPVDEIEEGRRDIYEWGKKRTSGRRGIRGTFYRLKKLFIDKNILKSFLLNLTPIIIIQMLLAGLFTYACERWDLQFDVQMAILISPVIFPLSFSINGLYFDVQMTMLVSPIVFPLAFSINADFQRREKVLEDLALFKGALMILFFCHRDWLSDSGLPQDFLKAVTNKLKGLIVNIKEYLLTERESRRNFILKVIYEDFSDIGQLNDKMRASNLPKNSPLITRLVHYHNLMCWAFERLRVVREYRSPRTIRSFTKVFISLMPLLLSPYYVFLGRHTGNNWAAYYVAIIVSFVFGTLQGVQDKLDDPFDGISEDDINLGQLEDWTHQTLLTNRTTTVGRFTVTTSVPNVSTTETSETVSSHEPGKIPERKRGSSIRRESRPRIPSILKLPHRHTPMPAQWEDTDPELDKKELEHLYPEMAHRLQGMTEKGLTGSTTILPGFHMKERTAAELDGTLPSQGVNSPPQARYSIPKEWMRKQAAERRNGKKKSVSFSQDPPSPVEGLDEENAMSPKGSSSRRAPVGWTLGGSEDDTDNDSSAVNLEDLPEGLRKVLQGLGNTPGTDFVHRGRPSVPVAPIISGKTPPSLSGLFAGPLSTSPPAYPDSVLGESRVEVDVNNCSKREPENLVKSPQASRDCPYVTQSSGNDSSEHSRPTLWLQSSSEMGNKEPKVKQAVDGKLKRKMSLTNRVSPMVDRRTNASDTSTVSRDAIEHQPVPRTTESPNYSSTHSSSPGSSPPCASPLIDIYPYSSPPTTTHPALDAFVSSTPSKYGVRRGSSPDVSPLATPVPTNSLPSPLVSSSPEGNTPSLNYQQTSSAVPTFQNSSPSQHDSHAPPPDSPMSSVNAGGSSPALTPSRFSVARTPTPHHSPYPEPKSLHPPDSPIVSLSPGGTTSEFNVACSQQPWHSPSEPSSSLHPPDSSVASVTSGGSTGSPPSRFTVARCPTPSTSPLPIPKSPKPRTDSLPWRSPSDSALPGSRNPSSRFNVTPALTHSAQLDQTDAPSNFTRRTPPESHIIDINPEVSSRFDVSQTNTVDPKHNPPVTPFTDQGTRDESLGFDASAEEVDTSNLLERERASTSSSENDNSNSERRPMIKKGSVEKLILSSADNQGEVFI